MTDTNAITINSEQLGQWESELRSAVQQLLERSKSQEGDLIVVGCSTSEIHRAPIGSSPSPIIGEMLVRTIRDELRGTGVSLAAQCCEHLNRSLVVEAETARARRYRRVNAVPQPAAGGSFATAAWKAFDEPWLVEAVDGELALDIGDTLIGMHLKPVVVPVRLDIHAIGGAHLTAARTRIPFTGGNRALYDDELK